MTTFHAAYLRRMFTRKQTTQEIFMSTDDEFGCATKPGEQDARAKPESDWLVGADRMREALYGFVLLAVFLAAVFAAAARIF